MALQIAETAQLALAHSSSLNKVKNIQRKGFHHTAISVTMRVGFSVRTELS